MAQASSKKDDTPPISQHIQRGLREGALYLFGAIALYLVLSLASYHPTDPGWSHSGGLERVANAGGKVGAWFADIALYVFGLMAYIVPVLVGYGGWLLYRGRPRDESAAARLQLGLRVVGLMLTVAGGAGIAHLHFDPETVGLPLQGGGVIGALVASGLITAFNFVGATLLLLGLFLAGFTLMTNLSWVWLMDVTGEITLAAFGWIRNRVVSLPDLIAGRDMEDFGDATHNKREPHISASTLAVEDLPTDDEPGSDDEMMDDDEPKKAPPPEKPARAAATPRPEAVRPKPPARAAAEPAAKSDAPAREARSSGVPSVDPAIDDSRPPLSLLDEAKASQNAVSPEVLEEVSRLVESKLADFGIVVDVVAVHPGPVITRFELQPAPGVKVSQITNLSKDLARALSARSVRVVEVIPGKNTVGLEVPNEKREVVYLSECLQSDAYQKSTSPLTLALGKDIGGKPMVADLAKMPHLLVAGTTGSGKSVAVNAMILSLLFNATARQVRLIMVDPKMLELSIYDGIPHLLAPVVTDMKDAANALTWCVAEMERRYRLMASLGVRNIAGYNAKVGAAIDAEKPFPDPFYEPKPGDVEADRPILEPIPFIVVVVDELADLMMVVGKKIEELIARLAQKARAAGIHLILATQRPSVDVITGLIKANIPTRIAFQVSSKIDSRTILDQMGAETLLGHGDMLYLPPGHGVPHRVHGAFVADHEVHNVVEELRSRGTPEYLDEIINGIPVSGNMAGGERGEGEGEGDPLYDEAVRVVTESRRASVSGVQRRLKIGYNRAARLVEEMERAGIVGPLQSNGSREVLVSPPPPAD